MRDAAIQPLATTWAEVVSGPLAQLAAVGPAVRRAEGTPLPPPPPGRERWAAAVAAALRSPVYTTAAAPAPDAVLNTVRYLFSHMRCGVLAATRGGRLALLAPFANRDYENRWATEAWFAPDCRVAEAPATWTADVEEYLRRRPGRRSGPPLLPPHAWWLNGGGVVCNALPATGELWGDAHLAELAAALRACEPHLPDATFCINKRDYPQLRADGGEPYARFTGQGALAREAFPGGSHVAVLSFYTGSQFADVPMPVTEDWVPRPPPGEQGVRGWAAAAPTACFRGAMTGQGVTEATNPRLALARWADAHPARLAFAWTGWAARDKIVAAHPVVVVSSTAALAPPRAPAAPVPLPAQAAQHRFLVYADGHCASNRWGALQRAGRAILRVQSTQLEDCGWQWALFDAVGWRPGHDPAPPPPGTDHVLVDADLGNLGAALDYLAAHDGEAQALAAAAAAKAPFADTVAAAWLHLVAAVAEAQTPPPAAPEAAVQWFPAWDAAYAARHKLDATQRFTSLQ